MTWTNGKMHKYVCLVMIALLKEVEKKSGWKLVYQPTLLRKNKRNFTVYIRFHSQTLCSFSSLLERHLIVWKNRLYEPEIKWNAPFYCKYFGKMLRNSFSLHENDRHFEVRFASPMPSSKPRMQKEEWYMLGQWPWYVKATQKDGGENTVVWTRNGYNITVKSRE